MDSTNLIAAQKIDPNIRSIIGAAPSVAIYGFADDKKSWVKSEHEGALLICERHGSPPTICIVILNQLKPQNFIEYMDAGISLQRKKEYLLYKTPTEEVRAVWFYNEADCMQAYEILDYVLDPTKKPAAMTSRNVSKSVASTSEVSTVQDGGASSNAEKAGKDILSILSHAQKGAPPRSKDTAGQGQGGPSGQAVGAGGDGRSTQNTTSVPVENLFKPFDSARNGAAAASTPTPPQSSSVGGVDGRNSTSSGGVANAQFSILGKGRGRAISPNAVAPAIQRLMVGSTPNQPPQQQQQQRPSAFSNFAATHSSADSKISGTRTQNNFVAGASLASPPNIISSPMSPLSSAGHMLPEEKNEELIAPSDLTDFGGRQSNEFFFTTGNTPGKFLSSNETGGQSSQGNAAASRAKTREDVFYLLEHDPEFVDFLDLKLQKRRWDREHPHK